MAEQLDVRLVLLTTDGVGDAGRVCDLLSEHGVRTVQQFSTLTEEMMREWGINDYYVYYYSLRKAQSLTRELATSPHRLPTVKQQLLDRALYQTCERGGVVRAQELLSLGANVNYHYNDVGYNGRTPLHISAAIGHTEVVAMLLQHPSLDINARDKDGDTPLHLSAYNGHEDVCNLLLNTKGISVNSVNEDGLSPLHDAARQGHLGIVRIFVEHGASLSLQDKKGRTPLDRAREEQKYDVVEYLQQQLDSKSLSATTPTATPPSTDATSQKPGDEDHTSTTADEDTHTDPNASPDHADSSDFSPPVDPSDAMDKLGLNVTMSIINIGAQGYPGTGKTSLLDLAMGKDPAETRNSTGCIDPPSRYLVAKSKSSQGIKWDHVTSDKMFDMVCDAVKETIDNPQVQTETSRSNSEQQTPSEASQPNIPVKPDTEVTKVDKQQTNDIPDDTYTSSIPSPRTTKPDRVPPKDSSWFLDLLKKTQESKGSGAIFDSHWMMMTDSGGQPPFLDASALFLQNSCLQIFPLKLNEALNHRPELSYFIDGKSACFSKSNLKLSNQQIIETMAKSVSAIQPAFTPSALESPKGAKFAIVGTFEDQAHLCSETVEDKESTLDKALKPYKDFQVRYGGKLILPVNTITADEEERKTLATKLRKLIADASGVTMKVLVKLRWFVFLLNMLTRADKQKRSVLTLEECLELGKALEMKESEVHKAIRFFRDINLIMHYNTPSLRNSVIVDAKPLLDKVSLLLSASFVDEDFLANHCELVLPSGAKELLQQHGRFSPETLENFIKFEEPISNKFFLDVLVEVKAVAAIDESSEYIMPCALSYLPDEQCVPHPSTPWVIRFRVERGVEEVFIPLPVGYLPALLVFLLTCFKSKFRLIREDCQFRNLFVLKYKRGGQVYIVERHLQLEIYFTSCEKLAGDCIVIRESILKAISLTEKRLRIADGAITKVDSFLCSCSANAHHVCIYNHETGIAECENTYNDCNLESQHLRWIKSVPVTVPAAAPASSSQPSTTTQTPEKPSSRVVDGDTAPSSSQVSSTTPQGAVKTSSPVVDEPKPDYSCPVCAELLTEPFLTDCGHLVCGTCRDKLLTTNKKDCPVCRETNGLSDARLDKRFQREVNSLRVHCEHHDKGCDWVGEVRDLQNHLDPERENCSYVMEHTQQTTLKIPDESKSENPGKHPTVSKDRSLLGGEKEHTDSTESPSSTIRYWWMWLLPVVIVLLCVVYQFCKLYPMETSEVPDSLIVYGETVLTVVGNKQQELRWPDYGFYLDIPEGALPSDVTANVAVKVISGDQFELPKNSQLISAVYWISSSEIFLKEVAVNIQHCAIITSEDQLSEFKFVISKGFHEVLPYDFKENGGLILPNHFKEREGLFSAHTQYGTIMLNQFSTIAVTAPPDTNTRIAGLMYYLETFPDPLTVDFHFVVVKDYEANLQGVNMKYQGWRLDCHTLDIRFKDEAVMVNQQEQEVNSWKIYPLSPPPQVAKDAVSNFQVGRRIPHTAFEMQLLDGKSRRLLHKVDLIGVASPDFFYIRYPQPESNKVKANIQPTPLAGSLTAQESVASQQNQELENIAIHTVEELLKELPTITDPVDFGIRLGVRYDDCQRKLQENVGNVNAQVRSIASAWYKESSHPTWNKVVEALSQHKLVHDAALLAKRKGVKLPQSQHGDSDHHEL